MSITDKTIETLEPEFGDKVRQLILAANGATGREWVAYSGRRTLKEQRVLYEQGRTTQGKIVTNATAGSSAHNFGFGVDVAPLCTDSNEIDWNAPDLVWRLMAEIAEEMGLEAGYFFKSIVDKPHVQDHRWKEVQAQWRRGDITIT